MSDLHQEIMDRAYDRWKADRSMSKQEFWDQLDAIERVAVFSGNMNYQVCNGGFSQWFFNGYAEPEVRAFLHRLFKSIDTPASQAVDVILTKVEEIEEDYPNLEAAEWDWEELSELLNVLDRAFYAVNDQLLVDVEKHLHAMQATAPLIVEDDASAFPFVPERFSGKRVRVTVEVLDAD